MCEKWILINLLSKQVRPSASLPSPVLNNHCQPLDAPNESHTESCLVCLDNMGQISIYTLPGLRRQILFSCIKASDINALSSVQFSPFAHAFYLQSSSELAQVTFSPQTILPYSMSIIYEKMQRRIIQRTDFDKSHSTRSPERNASVEPDALLSYVQRVSAEARDRSTVFHCRTPSKFSDRADTSTLTSVSERHAETPSKFSTASSPRKAYEVDQHDESWASFK